MTLLSACTELITSLGLAYLAINLALGIGLFGYLVIKIEGIGG